MTLDKQNNALARLEVASMSLIDGYISVDGKVFSYVNWVRSYHEVYGLENLDQKIYIIDLQTKSGYMEVSGDHYNKEVYDRLVKNNMVFFTKEDAIKRVKEMV